MDRFCLNCCAQCNHAFACSLAATMHTHTQLLLLATTVLVFPSLTAFVSSLPQVQTSHAAVGLTEWWLSS